MNDYCKICGDKLKIVKQRHWYNLGCASQHYTSSHYNMLCIGINYFDVNNYVEQYRIDGHFIEKHCLKNHMRIIMKGTCRDILVPAFDINQQNIEQVKAKLNMIKLMQ